MTAPRYPWALHTLHLEALVWADPVLVHDRDSEDGAALAALLADVRYRLSMIDTTTDEPYLRLHRYAEAQGLLAVLAYASGYTSRGAL